MFSLVVTQNSLAVVNPEELANESPITDTDIQIFLDYISLQKADVANPAGLEEAITKLADDKGVTVTRIWL